ncbi:elongation factor P maturation arginine rhamnosyltransferase EarP [Orrella sp. 11846]
MSISPSRRRIDISCQVIDNLGDIGVSWRLARQLQHEHHSSGQNLGG